jgi:predicted transcriptional regulator
MSEATFTFRVDDELKAAFAQAAKAQDRTGAQLLRDFMRDVVSKQAGAVEHDVWFRKEVEQGLREADDPTVRRIPNEEIELEWRQQRAELLKRARARP